MTLAQRHRHLIARLEPVGLNRYWITEKDIQTIERYLSIIQQDLKGESTWEDIIRVEEARHILAKLKGEEL